MSRHIAEKIADGIGWHEALVQELDRSQTRLVNAAVELWLGVTSGLTTVRLYAGQLQSDGTYADPTPGAESDAIDPADTHVLLNAAHRVLDQAIAARAAQSAPRAPLSPHRTARPTGPFQTGGTS